MKIGVHWLLDNFFSGGGTIMSSPSKFWTNKSSGWILSFWTPEGAIKIWSLIHQKKVVIKSSKNGIVFIKLIIL